MAIQVRYTGKVSGDLSFGGEFVVVCDYCGKIIDRKAPGNVEFPVGSAGECKEIFLLHKECSMLFRQANELTNGKRLLWRNLKEVQIETI